MNDELVLALNSLQDDRVLFIMCSCLIFFDVLTGYIKAFKFRKLNSSVSRDGYIKKVGWIVSLAIGICLDYLLHIHIFIAGTALVCVATEGVSIYENLGEIGIKLPFAKYFQKLKEDDSHGNEDI
jgi:toxin secretion/phage lysis holin